MLSAVLRSEQATQASLAIVRLRRMLATTEELARKVTHHDHEIGRSMPRGNGSWGRRETSGSFAGGRLREERRAEPQSSPEPGELDNLSIADHSGVGDLVYTAQ